MPRGISAYDTARIQRQLWRPGLLESQGLVAWYDASDLSTITAASNIVSKWADKSGNGYDLTTLGTGPTLDLNPTRQSSSGRMFDVTPGLLWTGTQSLSNASFSFPSGTKFSVFIRGYFWFDANSRALSICSSTGNDFTAGQGYSPCLFSATPTIGSYNAASSGFVASTALALQTDYLFSHVDTGAAINNYFNGGAAVTDAVTATVFTPAKLFVGCRDAAGNPIQGGIREIIILAGQTPSLDIVRKIEGYLFWNCVRTGLRNNYANNAPLGRDFMNASHPFKNRPPLIGD